MPSDKYIFAVWDSMRVMEDALGDVRKRLDLGMQRGECFAQEWNAVATVAKQLATRCEKLAEMIEHIQIAHN